MRRLPWICLFALLATPASAQRVEIAPFTLIGYAGAADIDDAVARASDLQVEGGRLWSASGGYLFTSHVGVEARWTQRETGLSIETPSSPSTTAFFMNVKELDGNFVYRFQLKERRLQPFMYGGVGIAILSSDGLDTEQKTAWNLGGGFTWFLMKHAGIRLDGRFNSIGLASSTSVSCAPLSFCQDQLWSIQWTSGLVLRF